MDLASPNIVRNGMMFFPIEIAKDAYIHLFCTNKIALIW